MGFEHRPVSKESQTKSKRVKLTQKQRGDINEKADRELKERSNYVCEMCGRARATERAHLIGRRHIPWKTRSIDLAHLCGACHDWADESGKEGKAWKEAFWNLLQMNHTKEN